MLYANNLRNFSRNCLFAAMLSAVPIPAIANTLDNPGDLNFNQLLGMNDNKIIVGYFGDGTVVPNNGYALVPYNRYAVQNFNSTPPTGLMVKQTQAIGINNSETPVTVGFWQDQNGVQ